MSVRAGLRPGSDVQSTARSEPDAQPDPARPPDASQPDASQPDGTQPDGTQPDGTQPVATRPRVYTGELFSFISALALLPIMFLLDWYGVVGLPLRARRSGITTAENAWRVLTDLRWLMLLAIAAAVGSVLLHVSQRSHGAKTDTSLVVTAIGTVTALLVGYRVLIDFPDSRSVVDVKIGAYLGLLCAIGIAIGGYESIRQVRERGDRVVQRSRVTPPMESDPDAGAGSGSTPPPGS
jgi:hypothetical protein